MCTKKTASKKRKFGSNKKLGLTSTMNTLGKPYEKYQIKNRKKTVNINVKMPHVNKRSPAIKRIFVQTPFSHSTLKLERKNFTSQNHSFFRSTSCFGMPKNHYSNLTSKIMKMCKQIFKKTAPQYNSNSLNC